MKTSRLPHWFALFAFCLIVLAITTEDTVAAPKKPVKPAAKVTPKPGIKKTPQMAGGNGQFGELYGLQSGFTYSIKSARLSYAPHDDYSSNFASEGNALLVFSVAIKNNTPEDRYFPADRHTFQVFNANNDVIAGGAYRLKNGRGADFSPTLKPGQGAGQDTSNPLEVAIEIPEGFAPTKIILQQGRKGIKEEVLRYFVAGTQGGNAKNIIAPLPADGTKTPLAIGQQLPSAKFGFKINGVSFVSGPIAGVEAGEGKRFAVVNLTVSNLTSGNLGAWDVFAGSYNKNFFTDADGENYISSDSVGMLKASADEASDSEFLPGKERTVRVAFIVPASTQLKTLTFGCDKGKRYVFDAAAIK